MDKDLQQSLSLPQALDEASKLVVRAMAILDEVKAPADIAARLDHAVCRMTSVRN